MPLLLPDLMARVQELAENYIISGKGSTTRARYLIDELAPLASTKDPVTGKRSVFAANLDDDDVAAITYPRGPPCWL